MDGRVVGRPDDNGSADGDERSQAAPSNGVHRPPLTIREVVRRGRLEMEESQRLRAEIEELRRRAEAAERALAAAPRRGPEPPAASRLSRTKGAGADPPTTNGVDAGPPAPNGVAEAAADDERAPAEVPPPPARPSTRWSAAVVVPSPTKS